MAILRGERIAPARDSRRHAHQRRGCRLRRQLAHVPRLWPLGQRHHGQAVTSTTPDAAPAAARTPARASAHGHSCKGHRHRHVARVLPGHLRRNGAGSVRRGDCRRPQRLRRARHRHGEGRAPPLARRHSDWLRNRRCRRRSRREPASRHQGRCPSRPRHCTQGGRPERGFERHHHSI